MARAVAAAVVCLLRAYWQRLALRRCWAPRASVDAVGDVAEAAPQCPTESPFADGSIAAPSPAMHTDDDSCRMRVKRLRSASTAHAETAK